jgi:hypothetical protein
MPCRRQDKRVGRQTPNSSHTCWVVKRRIAKKSSRWVKGDAVFMGTPLSKILIITTFEYISPNATCQAFSLAVKDIVTFAVSKVFT